jgi:choline-glycine betaine transporter
VKLMFRRMIVVELLVPGVFYFHQRLLYLNIIGCFLICLNEHIDTFKYTPQYKTSSPIHETIAISYKEIFSYKSLVVSSFFLLRTIMAAGYVAAMLTTNELQTNLSYRQRCSTKI